MIPLLVAVGAGCWAVAHAILVVPRLPAPVPDDFPGYGPPDYPGLVTGRNLLALFLCCCSAGQITWLVPMSSWPMWFVYVGAVGTLVGVDALTTFLPLRLTQLCASELCIAALVTALLGGWDFLPRAIFGALISGSIFWLVWKLSTAFGFGDVRLAVIVGFIAGTHSWTLLIGALFYGTLFGALFGLITFFRARRTGSPPIFPYGPALWLGPLAAILVSSLAG